MAKLLNNCFKGFVNLDHRTDRLKAMEKEFKRVGVRDYHRVPGVLPQPYYNDPRYSVMKNRTPGAIGCHIAQCNVMQEALKQGQHAFVMEDDLVFCNDFRERMFVIDLFCENNDWDIMWLGGTFHVGPPYWHKEDLGRDAELTKYQRIVRTYGAFSTHAYIVNCKSIQKVLDLLEQNVSRSIGIDWIMIQIQPMLKTYAFVPGCVKQYDNVSDQIPGQRIVTRYSKFETLNGTKENSAYWWQEYMWMFDPKTFDWKEAKI